MKPFTEALHEMLASKSGLALVRTVHSNIGKVPGERLMALRRLQLRRKCMAVATSDVSTVGRCRVATQALTPAQL